MRAIVEFREKRGPWSPNFNINKFLNVEEKDFLSTLKPTYEAIKKTKSIIQKDKSLIAFIGAPWTLIIYLYNLKEGRNIKDQITIDNKKEIKLVIDKLEEFLKIHIMHQITNAIIVYCFQQHLTAKLLLLCVM